MSGIKESAVQFSEERDRAVSARAEAEQAVHEGRAMVEELSAAVACGDDSHAFDAVLDRLRETLAQAEDVSRRAKQLLASWTLGLADVQQAAQDCRQALSQIAALRSEVRTAHANLGVRAELAGFAAGLQSQAETLARWDAELVGALRRRCQETGTAIEDSIRDGRTAQQHQAAVTRLRGELEQLGQSVRNRENQDLARDAVIVAIEEACRRLAFTVVHDPQEDPNRPRRFHVNTGAFGVIVFELSLDAVLRTDSAIVQPRICERWVEEFESQMARLGVSLQFHYPATGQPVRVKRTARGLGAAGQPRQQSLGAG